MLAFSLLYKRGCKSLQWKSMPQQVNKVICLTKTSVISFNQLYHNLGFPLPHTKAMTTHGMAHHTNTTSMNPMLFQPSPSKHEIEPAVLLKQTNKQTEYSTCITIKREGSFLDGCKSFITTILRAVCSFFLKYHKPLFFYLYCLNAIPTT